MTESKINLKSKLELIKDYWSPKVVAELNDYQFKLAKIKDEFIWHEHSDTDEAFIVIKGNIEIEIDSNNDYIIIKINDNGTGITDAKKAMTPYFTTKKTGSGLGLPIVNKINKYTIQLILITINKLIIYIFCKIN